MSRAICALFGSLYIYNATGQRTMVYNVLAPLLLLYQITQLAKSMQIIGCFDVSVFQVIFAHEDFSRSYMSLHAQVFCYFRGCGLLLDPF